MISAATLTFAASFISPPSPASRTSPSSIVSPASPASFSTAILSPAETRYCLPPVRTTANMVTSSVRFDCRSPRYTPQTTKRAPNRVPERAQPLGEEPGAVNARSDANSACCRWKAAGLGARPIPMSKRLLAALACACTAACASAPGDYPSLAIRDAERVSGTLQPAEPYVPTPVAPVVLANAQALVQQAGAAHESFLGQLA